MQWPLLFSFEVTTATQPTSQCVSLRDRFALPHVSRMHAAHAADVMCTHMRATHTYPYTHMHTPLHTGPEHHAHMRATHTHAHTHPSTPSPSI